MNPTRIHKIKKIDNYRIYQGWKPSGAVDFARVNVIYGQNGSGKSTLASLLQGCAAYAADESEDRDTRYAEVVNAGLCVEAYERDGASASSSASLGLDDRKFWARVRVFNKDFVRRNLRFEEADGPQPEALLTIGEKLADAEKKIEELESQLGTVRQRFGAAEVARDVAKDAVNRLGRKLAKDILSQLPGASEFNPRSYNRTNVEKLLDKFERNPTVLKDASVDPLVDRKRAISEAMQPIDVQRRPPMLDGDSLNDVHRLLAASVVTHRMIDQLVGSADRSRWVQEGIGLHEGLEECLFCGHGLTPERRDALNAHFDESVKKLQAAIDHLMTRLEESVKVSEDYLNRFPATEKVYEDLWDDLRAARQDYDAEHTAYVEAATQIRAALQEKRDNPFGTPVLTSDLALAAPSTAPLEKVVRQHQSRINSHENEARKAARRVEHYYVKNAAPEYSRLKKVEQGKQAAVNELQAQMKKLEEEIATLKNVDGDPTPGAAKLTQGLNGLLGRYELTFSVAQDDKHYAITRDGKPATHLSEGEQTAIALLYFLHSVREDKIQGDPPIVIIDDPVSSLDHGVLFGVSAHMWAELVVKTYVSQVFLLTHSFELFRQWLIQIERIPRKEWRNYSAYRVVTRSGGGGWRRPEFESWEIGDKRRKKLRSEYHFLFDQVATALTESLAALDSTAEMEVAALAPNSARKLLEGFLSFRSPNTMGDFRGSVRAVLDGHPGLDDSLRTRIVRYAHAHSHLEEADPMKPLELGEAMPFLRVLFRFMNHVDKDHFTSMCDALDHDAKTLLGDSMSSEPGSPS
ncbi:AAA family ATPase [Actinomyces trachealis]|uniref:AAA family ATPase n=1 Tax=Actinomyces trachealis TaxID=2763540 RepID=UPI0018C82A19|nr:AAA family ATPase [Actinomyces trachealis]